GSVSATAAALTADTLLISGTLNVMGLALLTSASTDTGAGITETGVLNLGTLGGSSATTASFTGTNAIGTLASFTAATLLLNDNAPTLTVAGSNLFGSSVTLNGAGMVDVTGAIGPEAAAPITVG